MIGTRELRLRVLDTLESVVKQFRTRETLYPLRVPREPLLLDELIARALGAEVARFDPAVLRARTLLDLGWDDGSRWQLWVAILPSGLKLFCDSGDEESRVLASGGRNAGDESDRLLLELLADSRGDHFGIEMAGGAPSRVRASLDDQPFLVAMFVNLFEGTDAEADIRAAFATPDRDAPARDFQLEVERWLAKAMINPRPSAARAEETDGSES